MQILVPANNIVVFRLMRERFKLKDKDKLRVNLKHLAYVDNIYNIYKVLKDKYYKYLIRMY